MNIKSTFTLLFLFFITGYAFAIDPVYEGANGIREKVFATNCLFCHSSNLTGSARNGAPASVNWDTYEATLPNATRAIERAVNLMTMPPASSGLPLLDEEQRTAMLAWQNAGFPRNTTVAATLSDNSLLTLPVVNIGNYKFRATLRQTPLDTSPTGIGFVLESAAPTTASSDNAATFFPETGELTLPSVELVQNGISQGRVSAEMTLVTDSNPVMFTLISSTVIP